MLFFYVLLTLVFKLYKLIYSTPAKCTDVLLSYCEDMPYTQTMFPSLLGHKTREESESSAEYLLLSVVESLLGGECNPEVRMLGCSVLAPRCESDWVVLPCRSTCDAVRTKCSHVFEAIEMEWPYFLNCDRFFSSDKERCYDPLEGIKGEYCGPLITQNLSTVILLSFLIFTHFLLFTCNRNKWSLTFEIEPFLQPYGAHTCSRGSKIKISCVALDFHVDPSSHVTVLMSLYQQARSVIFLLRVSCKDI